MKGLAIATGPDASLNELRVRAMLRALAHRGGDGVLVRRVDGACFGALTRRTLPEEESHEAIASHPSGVTAALDGRIDDAATLLRSLGAEAPARLDDLSIALAAFVASPRGFATEALGDFVFAAWDPHASTLHLVRDRIGTSSLAYAAHDGGWLVASEAEALAAAGVRCRPDRQAFAAALVEEHHERDRTHLEGVRMATPGALTELGRAEPRVSRCFRPETIPPDPRPDPEGRRLRELLRLAVGARMRSSGRVGVFASGGLDSSVVAAVAAEVARARGAEPPVLLTVRFPGLPCDEGAWSSALARHLGLELVEYEAPADPAAYGLDPSLPHLGFDPSTTFFRGLLEKARSLGIRTVLDGSGSDELQWRTGLELIDAWSHGPLAALSASGWIAEPTDLGALTRLARAFVSHHAPGLGPWLRRRLGRDGTDPLPAWLTTEARALIEASRVERARELVPLAALEPAQRTWVAAIVHGLQAPYGIALYDRVGAALGAQFLHPFYDHRIVSYFVARTALDRTSKVLTKPLLRAASGGWLPPEFVERRFGAEFSPFYEPIFRHHLTHIGELEALASLGLVERAAARASLANVDGRGGLSRYVGAHLDAELRARSLGAVDSARGPRPER